jgi:hypothetical protein
MPHRIGKCHCGRRIHIPNGSQSGDTWTCRRCGRTYTLTTNSPNQFARALGVRGQEMGYGSSRPYAPAQRSTLRNALSVLFAWLSK